MIVNKDFCIAQAHPCSEGWLLWTSKVEVFLLNFDGKLKLIENATNIGYDKTNKCFVAYHHIDNNRVFYPFNLENSECDLDFLFYWQRTEFANKNGSKRNQYCVIPLEYFSNVEQYYTNEEINCNQVLITSDGVSKILELEIPITDACLSLDCMTILVYNNIRPGFIIFDNPLI